MKSVVIISIGPTNRLSLAGPRHSVPYAQDQHATGGVPLHLDGDAPTEQTRHARVAMGPHDNEVRLPGARHLDDLLPREAVDDKAYPFESAVVHALEGEGQWLLGVIR